MSKYSSYILFLLISVLVVILYVNDFGPLSGLQQSVNDMVTQMTSEEDKRPGVVVVKIDQKAQNAYGDWPWNRDLLADLLAAVASAEPKAMLVDFDLNEDALQDSAGHTQILTEQMSWMDKLVVPYDIALSSYRSRKTTTPDYLFDFSLKVDNPLGLLDEDASLLTRKVFLPSEKVLQAKPYLGFSYAMPDDDRTLRHQQLVMYYEGYYYPSAALTAASVHLGLSPADITLFENKEIRLGKKRSIPVASNGDYYIRQYDKQAFRAYSAAKVLEEGFKFERLKNKTVIIAVDDQRFTELFRTPASEDTPDYIVTASVIDNIISDSMLRVDRARTMTSMIILFAIGAVFAFLLPQISVMYRLIVCVFGLVVAANVNYFMATSFATLPQTIYIMLELILFAIAAPFLDSILEQQAGTKSEKTKTPAKPPKPKKSKIEPLEPLAPTGETPVREIKASSSDPENISTAAIGSDSNPGFDHQTIDADVSLESTSAAEIEPPNTAATETPAAAEEASGPTIIAPPDDIAAEEDTILEDSSTSAHEIGSDSDKLAFSDSGALGGGQISNLGRYQVSEVLGKGAMGLVYRGVDPAINRPVALKTIRLDFVNDPEEMAELKERLHREAQAAGKLSHTNIVTIYDVGSEGQLQYIAMEYLQGQTLEELIKRKMKFNYRIIAQIIMQICSALDYAHDLGIVHRDIKPANIMVLDNYHVKVMDYGIARVDSSSMTKTGIAMGTPNYISPEQLQGKNTDRRSDLFSLGVVMYELLLGKRPFRGENITSLIYSVLNHEPEKPSDVNPQIPLLFDHIIGRSLKKEPSERYQKASEVMADLADFVEAFSSKS